MPSVLLKTEVSGQVATYPAPYFHWLLCVRCVHSTCVLLHVCFHETCISMHVLPRDDYFHMCASMRHVLPCVCGHETCTLHDTNKRGPHKQVMGMHCSIVVVPREITRVKMKLQLSGTIKLKSLR